MSKPVFISDAMFPLRNWNSRSFRFNQAKNNLLLNKKSALTNYILSQIKRVLLICSSTSLVNNGFFLLANLDTYFMNICKQFSGNSIQGI